MLQILCKTPAAIFKIQIPANTKSKFNTHPQGSPPTCSQVFCPHFVTTTQFSLCTLLSTLLPLWALTPRHPYGSHPTYKEPSINTMFISFLDHDNHERFLFYEPLNSIHLVFILLPSCDFLNWYKFCFPFLRFRSQCLIIVIVLLIWYMSFPRTLGRSFGWGNKHFLLSCQKGSFWSFPPKRGLCPKLILIKVSKHIADMGYENDRTPNISTCSL